MRWDVEGTDEFGGWYDTLSEEEQERFLETLRRGRANLSRRDAARPAAPPRRESPPARPASAPRARHEIVCTGCGQRAEVPFQPDPNRPVYCSACFTPRRRPRR